MNPLASESGGFNYMFTLVPVLIIIVFVFVIGGILLSVVRYFKNASSPKESIYATIISKRMDVRQHTHVNHNADGFDHSNASRTYYYITLEFDNGDRKEYMDVKRLYGLVAEGDTGYAQVQGEWIVAFERSRG